MRLNYWSIFINWLQGGIILLLFLYLLGGILVTSGAITPLRVRVAGKKIGGYPYFLALKELNSLSHNQSQVITFTFQGKRHSFKLRDLAISLSPQKSLEDWQNHFKSSSWPERWAFFTTNLYKPLILQPKVIIDSHQLSHQLEEAFQEEWSPPQAAKLSYHQEKLTYLPAKDGYQINQEKLIAKVRSALQEKQLIIELPVEKITLQPSDEAKRKIYTKAYQLLRTKIFLQRGDKEVELTPEEKISLLSFYAPVDKESLKNVAKDKEAFFNTSPENALFEFKDGRVVAFRPSRPGFQLNLQALETDLTKTIEDDHLPSKVTITIKGRYLPPKITTKDTNSYGIKELVGRGESWFWHSSAGRMHNVKLAASRLNGILVAPGEIFSFNKALGKVSAATGYHQSYVIKEGKTILDDGGGVCQVSTTLFRAVLHAGLPIIERHYHSYRVGYYEQHSPPGFDATVFAPHVDFRFKNDLPSYLLIQTTTDLKKHHLVFSLYGTKDGRRVVISSPRIWDQTPPPPPLYQDDPTLPIGTTKQIEWPAWGAKVAFDWQVFRQGKIIHQQTFLSVYKPWRAVYLRHL